MKVEVYIALSFFLFFGCSRDYKLPTISSEKSISAPTNSPTTQSNQAIVSTLAGNSASGFDFTNQDSLIVNATGAAARFASLKGAAVDSSGNVYISDNNTIRKITSSGVVTTIAGKVDRGSSNEDGNLEDARFYNPTGIAIDSSGNKFIADNGNNSIRKITPAGTVSTFAAGASEPGGSNFYRPKAIAIDSDDNLFVTDESNLIYKISPLGGTSIFVDIEANLYSPRGMAFDSAGYLYVADTGNNNILKISPLGIVYLFAGSGSPGSSDGQAEAASFLGPIGIAIDSADNLYVTDQYNHLIRKIDLDRNVSTLAGSGTQGAQDNVVGVLAEFSVPEGIAVDASGNLFVADGRNHSIRKIEISSGEVTTLAGSSGTAGNGDGTAASALFNEPRAVALDGSGNLLVVDSYNHAIRSLSISTRIVTTLTGTAGANVSANGIGTAARFNEPRAIAIDSSGQNLYVADSKNHSIRKIVISTGVVSTFAGSSGVSGNVNGDKISDALFFEPTGIVIDSSGNFYVADSGNSAIRKIAPDGTVSTLAVGLSSLDAIALDSSGNLYASDNINHIILKITSSGVITTLAGSSGVQGHTDGIGSAASFNSPQGLVVDNLGNLYVTDSGNSTVRKIIISSLTVSTVAGTAGSIGSVYGIGTDAKFYYPNALAIDSSGSNIYLTDYNSIRKINTSTKLVTTLAGPAGELVYADGFGAIARFNQAMGLAADSLGNIYVADTGNHCIRKINSSGVASTFAGKGGVYGSADGTGSAARFYGPQGIAIDSSGNIFVSDSGNSIIRKITTSGVVSTLAGLAGNSESTDGIGTSARFKYPSGLTIDSSGNLFVSDENKIRKIEISSRTVSTFVGAEGGIGQSFGLAADTSGNIYSADVGNHTILKMTPSGVVSTIAGTSGTSGSTNGSGISALFNIPTSLVLDSSGNLYVSDAFNHSIRKIVISTGVVSTFTGSSGVSGNVNDTETAARFNTPIGIARDSSGNLYVSDVGNGTIRKIR